MRRIDPFSPLSLMMAFFISGVLLPLYPFLNMEDGFTQYWPFAFSDRDGAALFAVLGHTLALICFACAYLVVQRGPRAGATPRILRCLGFIKNRPPLTFYLMGGIATLGLALTVHLLGGFEQLLAATSNRTRAFAGLNFIILLQNAFLSVGMAWALMLTNRRHRVSRGAVMCFAIYFLVSIGIIALQGAKATIFVYVIAMALIWHYRVRSFSAWKLVVSGAVLFVLLMIYHVIKQEYLVLGHFAFTIYGDNIFSAFLKFLFLQFTGNMMQLQTLAVLMDAMPGQLPFLHGQTLLMVALIWIPSALFPAKPLTAPGIFTLAFWPAAWLEQGTTLPPGYFGEMYMNFGWFGLIGGGLVAGLLYGWSYRAMRSRPDCDLTLGRHALFLSLLLHYFRGEVASVTVLFFTIYVPFWLIIKLSAPRLLVTRAVN
ncbi:O-antigen polymerase [Paraburkholderia sartisoli]|uniref:Oligosaccharide repeat unit polymerase n=1 Tax=Paraburkholderia sartisoli TaxID=83784 RepID=A0A1H4CPY9_9BURK|nr:O-antigen polymerase [Paraburkholderia sartisoli]SEA62440.1 oligosaccharide repeat unit polymerase [Paraburkholderia sartisoli]